MTTIITYTCQPGQTYQKTPMHFAWLNSGPATRNLMVAADGQTIISSYSKIITQSNGYTLTRAYSWKMIALPPE